MYSLIEETDIRTGSNSSLTNERLNYDQSSYEAMYIMRAI